MEPSTPLAALFTDLLRRLQAHLDAPDEAERALDHLTAAIEAQPGLSAAARRQAIAALELDRRSLKDGRRADLAAELRALCTALGLTTTIKVAKRQRRKPKRTPSENNPSPPTGGGGRAAMP